LWLLRRVLHILFGGSEVEVFRGSVLIAATISIGLVAGVFFAYASSIMPGLRETGERTFVGAFQVLDRAIINPIFMACFFAGGIRRAVLT
jgi:uncharacterized membrane protein